MGQRTAPATASAAASPVSDRIIRMHDPGTSYGGLVPGIGDYSLRAATLPGTVVVPDSIPPEMIAYLTEIGIGIGTNPAGLITVPAGSNLCDALTGADFQRVQNLLRDGLVIEPFQATAVEEAFADRLGVPFEQVYWAAKAAAAKWFNSKIYLRRLADARGLDVRFPPYQIVDLDQTGAVLRAVHDLLGEHGAFVKHGDTATGDGLYRIDAAAFWAAKVVEALYELRHRRDVPREILVDQAIPGIDASVQMEILSEGARHAADTLQSIKDGVSHAGNVLSTQALTPYPWAEEDMRRQAKVMADALWDEGYRGYASFDFMLTPDGAFLLECNARTTGGMYATAVFLQMKLRRVRCAVAWHVAELDAELDFGQVQGGLHDRGTLLTTSRGLLPAVVIALGGKTKVMVASVEEDVPAAVEGIQQLYELAPAA